MNEDNFLRDIQFIQSAIENIKGVLAGWTIVKMQRFDNTRSFQSYYLQRKSSSNSLFGLPDGKRNVFPQDRAMGKTSQDRTSHLIQHPFTSTDQFVPEFDLVCER
jgi:hypothetical protein